MKPKVLAADDSKTMREMISFTLQSAGYETKTAEDGKAALALLKEEKFDAVITDLNMPVMNGFELIRALRELPAYRFTPVLMLTTEGDDSKKQQGKEAGATGWIVKPFNPDKLISVLGKVCPIKGAAA